MAPLLALSIPPHWTLDTSIDREALGIILPGALADVLQGANSHGCSLLPSDAGGTGVAWLADTIVLIKGDVPRRGDHQCIEVPFSLCHAMSNARAESCGPAEGTKGKTHGGWQSGRLIGSLSCCWGFAEKAQGL
jgi:hypothetical protein